MLQNERALTASLYAILAGYHSFLSPYIELNEQAREDPRSNDLRTAERLSECSDGLLGDRKAKSQCCTCRVLLDCDV